MARDLNECKLEGRVGKITKDEGKLLRFSLACNQDYKDKKTDEWVKKTMWVECTAFGDTAHNIRPVVEIGAKLIVEGKVSLNEYTNKDGVAKSNISLFVDGANTASGPTKGQSGMGF